MKKLTRFLFILIIGFNTSYIYAQKVGVETGFKIPRYVSLKTDEANLRIGSSKNYPIILKYTSKNFPLKIIDEYDVWRKIIDLENNVGWIHESLLKGERYGIINQPYDKPIKIFKRPKGKIYGTIGKNNIVKIKKCLNNWCSIKYKNYSGWINKKNLWGVDDNEKIKVPFYQPLINKIWSINF